MTNDTTAYHCCSIDSRRTTNELQSTKNDYKSVSEVPSEWEIGTVNTSLPRITPSAAWARYMNHKVSGENATGFSDISSTAGIWNTSLSSASYYFPVILERILTTMVANGIARASYHTSMITTLKGDNSDNNQWGAIGWFGYMFPRHLFGNGSSIFDMTPEQRTAATEFHMSVAAPLGYAYSYKGATQKAAIGVLILYVLLAVLHFTYSLWDRLDVELVGNPARDCGLGDEFGKDCCIVEYKGWNRDRRGI